MTSQTMASPLTILNFVTKKWLMYARVVKCKMHSFCWVSYLSFLKTHGCNTDLTTIHTAPPISQNFVSGIFFSSKQVNFLHVLAVQTGYLNLTIRPLRWSVTIWSGRPQWQGGVGRGLWKNGHRSTQGQGWVKNTRILLTFCTDDPLSILR